MVKIEGLKLQLSPSNRSYWWGFSSLADICLVIQIVIGTFLAMHYTPHVDLAFNNVEQVREHPMSI
jgi:ubiquinol-cytochrome c reductase cytochrome b subunit